MLCLNVMKYMCVISGFCHEVDENCTLVGYYAVSSGQKLPVLAA